MEETRETWVEGRSRGRLRGWVVVMVLLLMLKMLETGAKCLVRSQRRVGMDFA